MIFFVTEILSHRPFLILRNMKCMFHEFLYALVFGCRNRNDRYPEQFLHQIDIDRSMVTGYFIHHIQCDYHRNIHLQKLHRQVQIALDVGCIDNIDHRFRLIFKYKIPRNDLLTAIWRHRINTRKICHRGIRMPFYRPVLSVNCHSRKISDMLV